MGYPEPSSLMKIFHLTLAFIGEYPEKEPVLGAMKAVDFSPFDLTLSHVGAFKDGVIWAGMEESDALLDLVRRLRCELARAGIPFDGSSFAPHMTLIQHTGITEDVPPVEVDPVSMTVDRFFLFHSTPGKIPGQPAVYTDLGHVDAR